MPLNLTPEEERFYYSVIETLKNHRGNISLEKLSDEDEELNQEETQNTTLTPPSKSPENDEVLNRLDEISKAKPIVEEKPKPIEKQIADSKQPSVADAKPEVPAPKPSIEDNPNASDEVEEFYDFESQKLAKDMELVTMLVFDDVDSIVGVDEKVYGPFRPQDLVTLPMINAKIFFKNRKGRQVKI